MKSLLRGLCIAGALLGLLTVGVAHAAPSEKWSPVLEGGDAQLGLDLWQDGRPEQGSGTRPEAVNAVAGPAFHYIQYPACEGNSPNSGLDTMCQNVAVGCELGFFYVFVFRAPVTVPVGQPGWEFVTEQCNTPGSPGTAGVPAPLPVMTAEDFQRLPLPAGSSTVEPPGGNVLVGMPTNVFATEVEPTLLDTTLLTYPVQVRATPERYSWDFGNGFVLGPTSEKGAAFPALTNSYRYEQRGSFGITMTTYYSGEYSVAGGPWLPVPGEAEVQSAPVTVRALAGRNELVGGLQP